MAVKTLSEKLVDKLVKIGLHERKAKELAKGLLPTTRAKTELTEKLAARLVKLGLTERKAKELAKALAPTVRAAIKVKAATSQKTAEQIEDDAIDEVMVRFDLPVASVDGEKGMPLLQIMDGWCTSGTYLVAAVRGEEGVVAIRNISGEYPYNVKFYPTMAYWGKTIEELSSLGAVEYKQRPPYERMHFPKDALTQLLARLEAEAKPKSKIRALAGRMKALTITKLENAFTKLVKYRQAA